MLDLLKKYRTVARFILTFVGSYFLLVTLYQLYLNYYHHRGLPDYFTQLVARQTEAVVTSFGYRVEVNPSAVYPLMELYINGQFIARIIEGCNSLSLLILFLAFMLAFFGNPKATLLFMVSGSVIIYVMNILRIALLSIGIYEKPQWASLFHELFFPLVIYGTVLLLWLLWIYIYNKGRR